MNPWLKNTLIGLGSIAVWNIGGCAMNSYRNSQQEKLAEAQRKWNAALLEARQNTRSADPYREGIILNDRPSVYMPAKLIESKNTEQRIQTLQWAFATKLSHIGALGSVTFGSERENVTGRRIVFRDAATFADVEYLANVASNGLSIIFNDASYRDSNVPLVDYYVEKTEEPNGITVRKDIGANGQGLEIILAPTPN